MMRYVLLFWVSLSCLANYAQGKITFAYDASGNRVSREIVLSQSKTKESVVKHSQSYQDMVGDMQVSISPNSETGHVIVQVFDVEKRNVSLTVYNVSGMQIYSQKICTEILDIDLSSKMDGAYILVIEENGNKTSWKIIKK